MNAPTHSPATHDVVVVLPTYDEADNIERMLGELLGLDLCVDVLVVDDSSPDGTGELVTRYAALHPSRVRLLTRRTKDGLGAAYRDGFAAALAASYDVVVQMDADGSHPVERLPALVEAVRAGAGLALGSRYVPGGGLADDWPWHRRALSRLGNAYARTMLSLRYRDLTGGFKAWRADLLAAIDLDAIELMGYAFQIETTLLAHRAGARIVEVPFVFKDRELGTSKMSSAVVTEAIAAVWRMRADGARLGPRRTTEPARSGSRAT